MQNLWILILCFFIGNLLRVSKQIPDNAHKTINAFILHISLPALILLSIKKISFSANLFLPAGMAWIIFFLALFILLVLKKIFSIDSKIIGCLLLTAGLGNTSFLGLPMIEMFFGPEFTSIGILCDQPGTFLILSLLGIPIALYQSSQSTKYSFLLKRILMFPPFISFLLAILLSKIEYSPLLISILGKLGDTLAPLALFSVGFQFKFSDILNLQKEVFIGLFIKMILAPLFIFWIYIILLENVSMISKISVFEAAMPPMITGGIIAMEYDLSPELASRMIAFGVLFSAISLPIWKIILDLF